MAVLSEDLAVLSDDSKGGSRPEHAGAGHASHLALEAHDYANV